MSHSDGRGHRLVMGAAVGALLLTAVSAAVVGLTVASTETAQAAPSDHVALGLGERVIDSDHLPAADKAGQLADSGTDLGDAPAQVSARKTTPLPEPVPPRAAPRTTSRAATGGGWSTALVSWYGPGFYGNTMAGGGTLTPDSMVVAHPSMPFGTRIEFAYGGRTTIAVVQDRGPYVGGRTFDLGPGTAKALGFGGVGTVRYRVLGR